MTETLPGTRIPNAATLYTFAPSHYCEKARWALDRSGLLFREVTWAPGLHVALARRLAARTTVPIFRTGGLCIQGSSAILDWIEAWGAASWANPEDETSKSEIARAEAHADAVIGVAVRRLVYAISLSSETDPVAHNLVDRTAWWQRRLAGLMWPTTREIMKRGLRATEEDVPAARDDVDRELASLDDQFADGRRFLVGVCLSRADIAVASLISPIARPPEHPIYPSAAPFPSFAAAISAWQSRPSLLWARALYRDFRRGRP